MVTLVKLIFGKDCGALLPSLHYFLVSLPPPLSYLSSSPFFSCFNPHSHLPLYPLVSCHSLSLILSLCLFFCHASLPPSCNLPPFLFFCFFPLSSFLLAPASSFLLFPFILAWLLASPFIPFFLIFLLPLILLFSYLVICSFLSSNK